jgi:hypothetical protein
LKNAVQELVQREQTMQQQAQSAPGAATDATPAPSPEAKKK